VNRPHQAAQKVREYALFSQGMLLRPIFLRQGSNISLGENVRIQRISSFIAEKPFAKITIGADSIIYENAKIEAYGVGQIEMGRACIVGDARVYARAGIKMGDRVGLSWNVFIQDFDPHPVSPDLRAQQFESICAQFRPHSGKKRSARPSFRWDYPCKKIEIGNDVWVGANSTILKGAKIGSGCVVAAGTVVPSGIYPDRSLIGGSPARVLKSL
jgi:acetyltransferase-like isoleucine patch superfamily enzyme